MNTIIVAMPNEAERLIDKLGLKSFGCYYKGEQFKLLVTGIGVSNVIKSVAEAMNTKFINEEDSIINVGYAGAKGIRIGDIVQVSKCERFRPSHTVKEDDCTLKTLFRDIDCVKCFTNDDFVEDDNEHDKVVYDMELYYLCRFFTKPISSIKVVSDNLDYHAYEAFDAVDCWDKVIELLKSV